MDFRLICSCHVRTVWLETPLLPMKKQGVAHLFK
ncbi:hypothetical protein ACFXTN_004757 [Malus domestica]